jgi:hypothetical protein
MIGKWHAENWLEESLTSKAIHEIHQCFLLVKLWLNFYGKITFLCTSNDFHVHFHTWIKSSLVVQSVSHLYLHMKLFFSYFQYSLNLLLRRGGRSRWKLREFISFSSNIELLILSLSIPGSWGHQCYMTISCLL